MEPDAIPDEKGGIIPEECGDSVEDTALDVVELDEDEEGDADDDEVGSGSTQTASGIRPVPAGIAVIVDPARLTRFLEGEIGPVSASGAACAMATRPLSASKAR